MNIVDNIQQENNITISNELILQKQFQHLNIKVYGTFENPLFKAKDIGDLLEIKNIREIIKNYNNKQRCDVSLTDAIGLLYECPPPRATTKSCASFFITYLIII